ncbi:aminotransferase class I/II-fold pyridoxal phosphate-dependent enzyme [Fretibacterium sp. OH1220_COT-178]|uniref:aminotransferase class I/II-fold pyridoxal phosphate-dependent enzyme n=1 Tax=Fretibacterium sp. OH1220_COT-178 TaxID=2491047 RepID=UPI000F5E8E68|nr:aminotransferase class I/II-fold pyridoxal phosphate-dependent enzyme [Fretibacterium sp. OH1220_COT-178]RRD63965.1 aminotransferase class I/II-fold pyridoxal phosphate-dependent enzyme [Fretibacterium sp. OH1220_COT-178]
MITSPLLTADVLTKPMINVVSFLKRMRLESDSELIDLSVGNPDLPPHASVIDELIKCSQREDIHGYGNFDGQPVLLENIQRYYRKRYQAEVAKNQIHVIRGVRNLLFSIAYIFVAPGETVLIPSIGYQSYYLATLFNHAEPYLVPMQPEANYVPEVWTLPEDVLARAKLLYLNYPNNPTGSQITREQLTRIVEVCRKYGILLCYDNAYNEIVFDGLSPISLFEIPGAWEIGIEITSMSKLTSLAGWRIAFCVANESIINYIWNYNAVTDSAVYDGFQIAGAKALAHVIEHDDGKRLASIYRKRRDIVMSGFDTAGITYYKPQGGFYMWLNVPEGKTDMDFAAEICRKAQVLLTPGSYYGESGAHNVRLSLTASEDRLQTAADRIAGLI